MKKEFIDELDIDIPNGVAAFLETQIGAIADISTPNTTDDAVIACGKLAANLNNALLKPFAGFTPIEALMRLGQKNPVIISSLLSNLEVITSTDKLMIISPQSGQAMTYDDLFVCTGFGIVSASVSIDAGMEFDLEQNGDVWSGAFVDELASEEELTATFTATFEGEDSETLSKTVSFTMAENQIIEASIPEADAEVSTTELDTLSVALNDVVKAESVTATVFGQTFTMKKQAGNTFSTELGELQATLFNFVGANFMNVAVTKADGTIVNNEISFSLFAGEQPGEG